MIEFRTLADDHPDLAYSPLLRGALLTLQYAQEHGSIGLTKAKAFKRVFVHWAVEHFDWPRNSAEEIFRYNKVINEYEWDCHLWTAPVLQEFSFVISIMLRAVICPACLRDTLGRWP